jgi:hypothetical protein
MPSQTFPHEADIGVRGTGATLEEAFPRCQDSCRLIGFTQTEPWGRKELCNAALLC